MANNKLRLGGPVNADNPDSWIKELKERRYRAAYCPVGSNTDDDTIKAYKNAALKNDIIIAEVGIWNNPLNSDENERKKAIQYCKDQLILAEKIGASCCVNIAGSRGPKWDGHDPQNLTKETFDMIVEITRDIIDAVNPQTTFFTLESMPWMYPDSPDSYLNLIKAIDRRAFAAHLDPVNMITSPQRYYDNSKFIKDCFEKLGSYIKSCHGKDIELSQEFTTHLTEVIPGTGNLDYATYLKELTKLDDIPLMLEHLKTDQQYRQAAKHVRKIGRENGIVL
jgi:sugar phosphate isomerase/epimerase